MHICKMMLLIGSGLRHLEVSPELKSARCRDGASHHQSYSNVAKQPLISTELKFFTQGTIAAKYQG